MWKEDLALELQHISPSERKHVLSTYEERTGRSRTSLYRIASEYGFSTGKKTRADKGVLKVGLTDRQIDFIAGILYETGRENKGPIMPVERAIQIAEDNEIIEHGQVTPSTMNRILRERQMSKERQKDETPHIQMRSLHPNHVHEFDVSVCIQYYLKNGKMGFMNEHEFYKNKIENFKKIKEKILRYVLVDHFSGAYFFKYYNTTGETQPNLWDFLKDAWAHKGDDKYPFRGVPFMMLMDAGAANTSKAMIQYLERLGVNFPKSLPHNPRRQGCVEVTHNIIEPWFETSLRIRPATSTDEMNVWASDFAAWHCATKEHTRHGMTRSACWMLINEEQLRELPEEGLLQELYAQPEEECTVNGQLQISYKGKPYSVAHVEGIHRNAKIMRICKPLKAPLLDVSYKGKIYEIKPVEQLPAIMGKFNANAVIIGQEYKAQRETLTQKAIKRFDNLAYGEEKKKNAIPFEGLKVFGNHAEKIGSFSYIEKKSTPIEVDRAITKKSISFMEFLKRLIQEIGPISRELNQQLRAEYGDSIEILKAEEVIRQLASQNEQLAINNGRKAAMI